MSFYLILLDFPILIFVRYIFHDITESCRNTPLLDRLAASYRFGGPSSDWLLPLHSSITSTWQKNLFLVLLMAYVRLLQQQTLQSIRVDDVVYVINCGKHKENHYNPQRLNRNLLQCIFQGLKDAMVLALLEEPLLLIPSMVSDITLSRCPFLDSCVFLCVSRHKNLGGTFY
ncbi:uncharacterized protein LOC111304667 isoform X4 [Durio zibethinus]|uniref:Uncharacterized protein LOC111304667 isoform X4 n=1 Tax=Durio zibethinus TaxID=66656 RepID=A0A6P5ZXN3_DURZI|nr:uncharacterized protein LOC111304667 isoform X4 [Durio zibethinus]XP_022757186.1 uncharacterized protein LOC111304667 isoform X4 [Durio zibethinus]XP_022757187.1 uncharacterized protein LOC111304667 isoform X4 [Durio zibethinus]XP_022757189.1 uncharacterized protein LOC111304667 isoform X4 [Durio zibethinus]